MIADIEHYYLILILSMIHLLPVKNSRMSRQSKPCTSHRFHITRHIGTAILYPHHNLHKASISPYQCQALTELTLTHDNAAHEHLNWSYLLQRHLALSCCLPQSQLMSKFFLAHCIWVIYFVAQDQERCLRELLHREQRVKLGF